jgi:hypothetical protein
MKKTLLWTGVPLELIHFYAYCISTKKRQKKFLGPSGLIKLQKILFRTHPCHNRFVSHFSCMRQPSSAYALLRMFPNLCTGAGSGVGTGPKVGSFTGIRLLLVAAPAVRMNINNKPISARYPDLLKCTGSESQYRYPTILRVVFFIPSSISSRV